MNSLILGLTGLFTASLWLVLLVVTGFSLLVVSVGLLGVLYVLGSTSNGAQSTNHTLRPR